MATLSRNAATAAHAAAAQGGVVDELGTWARLREGGATTEGWNVARLVPRGMGPDALPDTRENERPGLAGGRRPACRVRASAVGTTRVHRER